jgi:hypothetical protein
VTDPLRDLERRVDALAARVDLNDQAVRSHIDGIRDDIEQLREAHAGFVTLARFTPLERLFWAAVTALIVGLIGGLVAVVTRQ